MQTATILYRRERLASLQLPGTVWFGRRPVEPVRRLSTGISALDSVLGGGLPRGALTEITGPASSGRTALMCVLLASATRQAEVTAVVDLFDALHPESLERAGADLHRVLWVRPPSIKAGLRCADLILGAGGFGLVVLDLCDAPLHRFPLHVWPRLVRATEQSRTATVVLARQQLVGSFAALSMILAHCRKLWSSRGSLFDGLTVHVAVARNRSSRLPARPLLLDARP